MAISCMWNASGHNYRNSSFIVELAVGQISRSAERILVSSFSMKLSGQFLVGLCMRRLIFVMILINNINQDIPFIECQRCATAWKTKQSYNSRCTMWWRHGLMSLQTQCPASNEHVSAAEARRNTSCRHLKHACQDLQRSAAVVTPRSGTYLLGF